MKNLYLSLALACFLMFVFSSTTVLFSMGGQGSTNFEGLGFKVKTDVPNIFISLISILGCMYFFKKNEILISKEAVKKSKKFDEIIERSNLEKLSLERLHSEAIINRSIDLEINTIESEYKLTSIQMIFAIIAGVLISFLSSHIISFTGEFVEIIFR